ncbi:MAG: PKD domain-containing protein [Bacteroidota bacterium]
MQGDITIDSLPTAYAGPDTTLCGDTTFHYCITKSIAKAYSSLLWTTNGTGLFKLGGPTVLHPCYYPSVDDISNGSVQLTLTVHGSQTCSYVDSVKTITLSFHQKPLVIASGPNSTCAGSIISLNATQMNSSIQRWISISDPMNNSFSPPTGLSTSYQPSNFEKNTLRYADLAIEYKGTAECLSYLDTSNTVHVIITPLASATMSGFDTICTGDSSLVTITVNQSPTSFPPWHVSYTLNSAPQPQLILYTPSYSFYISPPLAGDYDLSLTGIVDANQCQGSINGSANIYVRQQPADHQLTSTHHGIYCQGSEGVFIGLQDSDPNIKYELKLMPSGTLKDTKWGLPNHGPVYFLPQTSAGKYKVLATQTFAGNFTCSRWMDDSVMVSVATLPMDVHFTGDTTCIGDSTHFYISGSEALRVVEWVWNFNDGHVDTMYTPVPPVHKYQYYHTFYVTLIVTDSIGCKDTIVSAVIVSPLPRTVFGVTNEPLCENLLVKFHDYSTNPGICFTKKWEWIFGDGTPHKIITYPGDPNVSHKYASAGYYDVVLIITNNYGCQDIDTLRIFVQPKPLANFDYSPHPGCEMEDVQFINLSQINGTGGLISYYWDLKDPSTGTNNNPIDPNPIHQYSHSGTFDSVMFVVWAANTCLDTVYKTVIIAKSPFADFRADTACFGTPTHFTNLSSSSPDSIITYHWDFGDSNTSTDKNPTYPFNTDGIHTVILTVKSDNFCSHDTIHNVLVLPKPLAQFSIGGLPCEKDSIVFTDLSTTTTGYIHKARWYFGDTQSMEVTYPTGPHFIKHAYVNPGTYTVTLVVRTSDSCYALITHNLIVNPKPQAQFFWENSQRCVMTPVHFHDNSNETGGIPIHFWRWGFGNPQSGINDSAFIKDPWHSFTTDGPFIVTLKVYNDDGCWDTINHTININKNPIAKFTTDTACVGTTTHFTDGSNAGSGNLATWLWNFGEPSSGTNNTSTQQNPTHDYAGPGTYNVTLTVTNSLSCQHDTIIQVSVNPKPQAMFQASTACVMDATHFTDLSIAPGSQVVSWNWLFGDGGSSTQQHPNHSYATSGTYNVHLRVTNLAGCVDSIIQPVVVRPKPVAAYTYTSFFCPKGQVNFQDQSQGTGSAIVSHLWIFDPGNQSTLVNPVYTFPITDTIYVVSEIVVDNYGCKDTITDSVHVKPGFKFSFNYDTVCFGTLTHFNPLNQTPGDSLYSPVWDFGDPNSGPLNKSYAYSPVHRYSAPGSYVVRFKTTDSDNCTDSVFRVVIVRALPQPSFKYSSIPCDSVLMFNDSSFAGSGSISKWIWSWGDGGIDTLNAPPRTNGDTTHVYHGLPGYRNVLLTVINQYGCSDSVTHNVQTFPCIMARYDYRDTLRCARYPVMFNDSSTPTNKIMSWHWTFGDGTGVGHDTTYTNYTGHLTHTYADSGRYIVKLKISAMVNTVAFQDSMVQYVVVHPTPLTRFANPNVCKHQITLFRDTSNSFGKGITKWWWNFGDKGSSKNTDTVKNPPHKYDTTGIYDVKLVVMNRWGCKDSLTKPTRIYNLPVAHFSNTVACIGNPTYFNDQSIIGDTTIMAWHWDFGDLSARSDTSNLQDPNYNYHVEGPDTVRFIVRDRFGCRDTVDSILNIHQTPISTFSITGNVDGIFGQIQVINHSDYDTASYWTFGDDAVHPSYDRNPDPVIYKHDGTFIIRLISTGQFCCQSSDSLKYEMIRNVLLVPNALYPDHLNSGTNDPVREFRPVGINLARYILQIFDQTGHMVFETRELDTVNNSPKRGWDGTQNGLPLPSGTYMWKIEATFQDGTIWEGIQINGLKPSRIGTVTLLR